MGFDEILGFIISMLALAFIIGRQIYDEYRKRNPSISSSHGVKRKDSVLQDFLRSLNKDVDEEVVEIKRERRALPPPLKPSSYVTKPSKALKTPRTVQDDFRYQARLDGFQHKSQVDARNISTSFEDRYVEKPLGSEIVSPDMRMDDSMHAYDLIQKKVPTRGEKLLKGLHSRKNMILIHEILSLPKGLRGIKKLNNFD